MIRRLAGALLAFVLTAGSSMLFALSTGAQDDRAHQIGKKLKCMCGGCNDTAATCYHVGGAFSGPCGTAKGMLKKIDQQVARGDSDGLRRFDRAIVCAGVRASRADRASAQRNRARGVGHAGCVLVGWRHSCGFRDWPVAKASGASDADGWRFRGGRNFSGTAGARAAARGARD